MTKFSLIKLCFIVVGAVRIDGSQQTKAKKCEKSPETLQKVDAAIKECQDDVKLKIIKDTFYSNEWDDSIFDYDGHFPYSAGHEDHSSIIDHSGIYDEHDHGQLHIDDHHSQVQYHFPHHAPTLDHHPPIQDHHPHIQDHHPHIQDQHPQIQDIHPQIQDIHPHIQGHHPQIQDLNQLVQDHFSHHAPIPDHHPQIKDIHPHIQNHHPQIQDHHPQIQDLHPQIQDHHSQVKDHFSHHAPIPDHHPQIKDIHPHIQNHHPQIQDHHTQIQDHHTHIQDQHPQIQDIHPHIQDHHPHIQDQHQTHDSDKNKQFPTLFSYETLAHHKHDQLAQTHHSHDIQQIEAPLLKNPQPFVRSPEEHVKHTSSLSDNPIEQDHYIDYNFFRKKRHANDHGHIHSTTATYHDRRIAGCIMQCIYEKNHATDMLGWPTLDGLVNFYSEGVNEHGYFMATLRAVDYCLKGSSAKYHVSRRSNPEKGQECDVAFDVFDCISDQITEYCSDHHHSD